MHSRVKLIWFSNPKYLSYNVSSAILSVLRNGRNPLVTAKTHDIRSLIVKTHLIFLMYGCVRSPHDQLYNVMHHKLQIYHFSQKKKKKKKKEKKKRKKKTKKKNVKVFNATNLYKPLGTRALDIFVSSVLLHPATLNEPRHDKPTKWVCAQRRLRSAWASAQSDQSLRCPHEETLDPKLPTERTAKTLIRLGGRPGWSESSLGAQSFCWFCHVVAQMQRHNCRRPWQGAQIACGFIILDS